MKARRATVDVSYAGTNITTSLEACLTSFSYTDPDNGESDNVSLTVADPEDLWISSWLPTKGDTMTATIVCSDWESEGDAPQMSCGTFTIDDMKYSAGRSGNTFTIGGVSSPADEAFTATERTQTWEEVTLQQVASEIAGRYGLSLLFDAEDVTIATEEQSGVTDSSFLESLCSEYGLMLKVYSDQLIIFDRETYKAKGAVTDIDRGETTSFTWNTTLEGTYTGGTITYTDPETEEDVTYTSGDTTRLLNVNTKADSVADAQAKIEAALEEANHGMTSVSLTVMGRPDLAAAQTFNITGAGAANGKYYIDKIVHSVSRGSYTSKIEASLCDE